MPGQQRGPGPRVAIVAGNAVVGEALEVLLLGLGYRARFEPAASLDAMLPRLADVQLVVIGPGLSACRRAALLPGRWLGHAGSSVPVIELTLGEPLEGGDGRQVRWPCRAEELARAIDAALNKGRPSGPAAGGIDTGG
jgi:hypothetical protein